MLAVKPEARKFSKQECEGIFAALKTERHIALAVSGGSDSTAMLRLAAIWANNAINLTVLTVDHGLRSESSVEAQKVAAWCADLCIDHHVLSWVADKPKTGLQAKARTARYDLMANWCKAHDVRWLLTAHTQDDQAETVFMRQARTSTSDSLAGIWQTSEWLGVKIFRPLLEYRRIELQSYLSGIGQCWIDDPSNEDERFERVRVRKVLAGHEDRVAGLAQIARDAGRVARSIEASVHAWIEQNLKIFPEGFGLISRVAFGACGVELQRRLVLKLVHLFGSGTVVTPPELESITDWIALGGQSRRTLGGAVVACRKASIMVGREPGRILREPMIVPESGKMRWDGRFDIDGLPGSKVVPVASCKGLARRKDLPAFVQAGLPAILMADGSVIAPNLHIGTGAAAIFIRYLR